MTTTQTTPWTAYSLDGRKMREIVAYCRKIGVPYKLGGKAPSLSSAPEAFTSGIDCSGFVRYLVFKASDGKVVMPDGSWYQDQWADKQGFKRSTPDAGLLKDGRIRLAYWRNPSGISHIALILNGKTLESHGGKGPNRRTWSLSTGWMRDAKVWVLDMEQDDAGVE